jgi:hypothetical protein
VPLEFTPFLGILAGIALTLLLSSLVIIAVIRLKNNRGNKTLAASSPGVPVPSQVIRVGATIPLNMYSYWQLRT